jgi:hypothetical protein
MWCGPGLWRGQRHKLKNSPNQGALIMASQVGVLLDPYAAGYRSPLP